MKKVYLHGKLGKRFGKKWEISAHTPSEIIKAIDANSDGFCEYICKKAVDGEHYFFLKKNPKNIKNEKDVKNNLISDTELSTKYKNQEIHVVSQAYGGFVASFFVNTIGGVFVAGGLATSIATAMVWGVVSQVAMSALFKPPKPPTRGTPTTTKSYLLSGAQTRQAQGIAVPLGYGRLRIGAANVSQSNYSKRLEGSSDKKETLESFVSMEFIDLLCEGPIEGFVNKNGGAISGGDIREGIYLNEVQVKNSPNNSGQEGTFNYVLNESEDSGEGKPEFKNGSDLETKILSDKALSIIQYDTLLYGAGPYVITGDNKESKMEYSSFSEAQQNNAKIISHFVSNSDVNTVTFSFKSELAIQKDDGNTDLNDVRFAIVMVRSGNEYNILDQNSGCTITSENKSIEIEVTTESIKTVRKRYGVKGSLYKDEKVKEIKIGPEHGLMTVHEESGDSYFKLKGIASSPYQFDIDVSYDPEINSSEISGGVTFKIIKLSAEYDPSVKGGTAGGIGKIKRIQLAHVMESIDEKLLYPNSAMIKVLIDSKNFSQSPQRTYHLKLKKLLIPSNYDPTSRKYDGAWDGLFKGQLDSTQSISEISEENKYWTDNPAWIFYDLLHNPRYGIGKYGLEETNIDKWQLYKVAKYCDELVETNYPVETATGKPRGFSYSFSNEETSGDFSISITGLNSETFIKEFGNGGSYKGKKIALFIKQHNFGETLSSQQESSVQQDSINREGEIIIEERVIISTDAVAQIVNLSGPNLNDSPTSFQLQGQSNFKVVGACATQINYPLVEPRFVSNLYLTERSEALEIINSMASVFRGMVAYSAGKVSATNDSFKLPVQLFNNSNIIGGEFSYSGVHKNKKTTASIVRFNNKDKNFKPDLVYEEDASSMQSLGYVENETMGFGITSEGQARRLARWILLTSQLETESIKFQAGQEASYLLPGLVFEVSDEARTASDKSGRILDIGTHRNKIILNNNNNIFVEDVAEYFDPYILIDKSCLSSAGSKKVDLSVYSAVTNETLDDIERRAPFEQSDDDQMQEIESLRTAQIIRFQGDISIDGTINKFGPQGQKTIVENLKLKTQIDISLSDNYIKVYNHSLVNGDQISFASDGVLPGGIIRSTAGTNNYYVINSTKHTFQISSSLNGSAINIYNVGKDSFGNKGGMHYILIDDQQKIIEALNQLSLGSAYSIKGLVGTTSETAEISSNIYESLGLDKLGNFNNWYESDFLGSIYASQASWIYSTFFGWIYVDELKNRVIDDPNGFWMYIGGTLGKNKVESSGIGWVWTNDSLKNNFWYVYDSASWVSIIYKDESLKSIVGIFAYEDSLSLSVGSKYIVGKDQEMFISGVSSNGYYLVKQGGATSSRYIAPINQSPPTFGNFSNPAQVTASISSLYAVNSEDSIQGVKSIRVELDDGHGIDLTLNSSFTIYGLSSNDSQFDSIINNKWYITKIDENVVELNVSSNAADLIDNIILFGSVFVVNGPSFASLRNLEGQLFRTVNIKEVAENKYEVTGLEYNSSKFFAVDKKGAVRPPALPIPPQADMSIPEAPDGLLLFDLTV